MYDVRGAGASGVAGRPARATASRIWSATWWRSSTTSPPPGRCTWSAHDWGSVQAWEAVLLAGSDPRLKDRIASYTSISGPALGHFGLWTRSARRGTWGQRRDVARQLLRSWYILAFQVPRLPELALRRLLRNPESAAPVPEVGPRRTDRGPGRGQRARLLPGQPAARRPRAALAADRPPGPAHRAAARPVPDPRRVRRPAALLLRPDPPRHRRPPLGPAEPPRRGRAAGGRLRASPRTLVTPDSPTEHEGPTSAGRSGGLRRSSRRMSWSGFAASADVPLARRRARDQATARARPASDSASSVVTLVGGVVGQHQAELDGQRTGPQLALRIQPVLGAVRREQRRTGRSGEGRVGKGEVDGRVGEAHVDPVDDADGRSAGPMMTCRAWRSPWTRTGWLRWCAGARPRARGAG